MPSIASRRVGQDLAAEQQQQSFASTKFKDAVRVGVRCCFLAHAVPLQLQDRTLLRGASRLP